MSVKILRSTVRSADLSPSIAGIADKSSFSGFQSGQFFRKTIFRIIFSLVCSPVIKSSRITTLGITDNKTARDPIILEIIGCYIRCIHFHIIMGAGMSQMIQKIYPDVIKFVENIRNRPEIILLVDPVNIEIFGNTNSCITVVGASIRNFVFIRSSISSVRHRIVPKLFSKHQGFFNILDYRSILIHHQFMCKIFYFRSVIDAEPSNTQLVQKIGFILFSPTIIAIIIPVSVETGIIHIRRNIEILVSGVGIKSAMRNNIMRFIIWSRIPA